MAEALFCTAQPSSGASAKAVRRAFEVQARAEVAAPLLEWSRRGLVFSYVYASGTQPQMLTEVLEMRCGPSLLSACEGLPCLAAGLALKASDIPVDWKLTCWCHARIGTCLPWRFLSGCRRRRHLRLTQLRWRSSQGSPAGWRSLLTQTTGGRCQGLPLQQKRRQWLPAESNGTLTAAMAVHALPSNSNPPPPLFRHDLRSHAARGRLQVTFADNPQTDAIELTGEVEFPNLQLDVQVGEPDKTRRS